jgi:hypothetical protein
LVSEPSNQLEWNRQRTATQKALCEKYELENEITRGQVLNRAELAKGLALRIGGIKTPGGEGVRTRCTR